MSREPEKHDVIIIGGGPAGLSAALWCADLKLNSVLIEKASELGGQLLWTFNEIKNYLGCDARNGRELAERFLQDIENTKVNCITGCEIIAADLENRTVTLAGGTHFSSRAIVIATGVRRRKLGVPGEDEFAGRGILESGVRAKNEVIRKTVVVVGGGDAALENAVILSETASKVILVHRRDEFSARREFVEAAKSRPNVEFLLNSAVTAFTGAQFVEAVEIKELTSAKRRTLKAEAVLIRVGICPNTELFRGQIDLDPSGFVITNRFCETSRRGIYAAGDVTDAGALTISAAAGAGSAAVKRISSLF